MKNIPQRQVQAIAEVKVSLIQIRKKITKLNNKMKNSNKVNQKVYLVKKGEEPCPKREEK